LGDILDTKREEDSVTAIVPALNEEKYIEQSVHGMIEVFRSNNLPYEIIIINDGSSDRTGEIAEALAKKNKNIQVVHHETPKGLGGAYKVGIALTKTQYVIMLVANNENDLASTNNTIQQRGKADMIIPFPRNMAERPVNRQIASRLFTAVAKGISGAKVGVQLKYYNGSVLHKTELIKSINIKTDSYAYQAEALIKLISRGNSFIEVPKTVNFNQHSTSAFKINNFVGVGKFFLNILFDFQIRKPFKRPSIPIPTLNKEPHSAVLFSEKGAEKASI